MRVIIRRTLFTVMCLAHMSSLFANDGLRPRGDVNCDWEVNIGDVNALLDTILAGSPYNSLYNYWYDVNGDKEINVSDMNVVISAILGQELPPMPTFSGTVPVLFINTEGHRNIVSREKEDYLQAEWWLDNMGHEEFQSLGSPDAPLGTQIKGRGNATWTYVDKKSFRLKLDAKQELMGMPSNKHWNLMAYPDSWMGKISDALAFEIGRRMGMVWNPLQQPVEVVLNGQYIGMYFLTEKIRVDKNRVNIIEQKDNETDSVLVTGGWLLELDNYDEPGQMVFEDGDGQTIRFTPQSPEVLSNVQRDYITTFLMKADSAIFEENKTDRTWENFIDIDALAIYYITQEVIDNPEAFSGSCYMSKERGDSTLLVFGPMWDCGSSFQRYSSSYQFNKFIYEELPSYCQSHWIAEIAKFPHFQDVVRTHWEHFYNEVYPAMDAFIDAFAAQVEAAGNTDYVRWPQYSANEIPARLNQFYRPSFHKKVAWLNTQWGESTTPSIR